LQGANAASRIMLAVGADQATSEFLVVISAPPISVGTIDYIGSSSEMYCQWLWADTEVGPRRH
jgi:hypothetical protein